MSDSGVVFDAAADRLLISANVLNMNGNYTFFGRSKLNSDLNAIGVFMVMNDNNVASLSGDYVGVASDGTGFEVSAVVAGSTTTATGGQLKLGQVYTWGIRRIGNRLEGWLNGRLVCFLNVSISGRASATRLEIGAATSLNVSRTDAVHGNLLGYAYALDTRLMPAQMANLDRALGPNPYGLWLTPKGTGYRIHDFSPNRRDWTEGGTLADAPLEPQTPDLMTKWLFRGPITFSATLSGAITPTGSIVNQARKILTGGITPTGALAAIKTSLLSVSGSIAPSGTLTNRATKILSGGTTPSGSLINRATKLFSAGITPTGSLTNRPGKVVSGAVSTISGALVNRATKVLAGTQASAGALINRATKLLAGGITPSGSLNNRTTKILSGGMTPTGALATIKLFLRTLTGNITPTGSLVNQARKVLSGGVTPAGSLINQTRKLLSGGLTPSGALSAIKTSLLFISGSITPTGTLTKRPTKLMSGSVTPLGTLTNRPAKLLSGAVASITGTLTKQTTKLFGGSIAPTGVFKATATKTLSGVVTSSGGLINRARKLLGGLINAIGDFAGALIGGGGDTGDGIPPVLVRPIRVDLRRATVQHSLIVPALNIQPQPVLAIHALARISHDVVVSGILVEAFAPLRIDIRQKRIVYDVTVGRIVGTN